MGNTERVKENIENVLRGITNLGFVSNAKIVGSFATGKKKYKDVDILVNLKITDDGLRKDSTPVKRAIVKLLKQSEYTNIDLFVRTADGHEWRMRPWVDDSLPKSRRQVTWDWEDWADWSKELTRQSKNKESIKPRLEITPGPKLSRQNIKTISMPRPRRGRLVSHGVYADKGNQRITRKRHRGWRRIY